MDAARIGVIGIGHLGWYHARAYTHLPGVQLAGLYDANVQKAQDRGGELGVPAVADMDELLASVDAVSVAVPTQAHHRIVKRCLETGVHVLVEKPIATTLEEADDLICSAREAELILQVGHIERFNPAFLALTNMDLSPMFIESHRLAPYTPRGVDVAVILDLMIHDIDLVLALVHDRVSTVEAAGVAVLSDSEDIANARVTFSNGAVANLTASRISAKAMRKMRLFQRDTYISADFLDHMVEIYRLRRQEPEGQPGDHPLGSVVQEVLLSRGQSIICERPQLDKSDALSMELGAFVDSICKGKPPAVSGQDGREALELALRILKRLQEHGRGIEESEHP